MSERWECNIEGEWKFWNGDYFEGCLTEVESDDKTYWKQYGEFATGEYEEYDK